jgi:hypothetical protein
MGASDHQDVTLRVPVELVHREPGPSDETDWHARWPRCWRLASAISRERLTLDRALPFPPGTRLRVRFVLPFDPPVPVDADGEVRRAAGHPSEVALSGLSATAHDALARYLEEQGG